MRSFPVIFLLVITTHLFGQGTSIVIPLNRQLAHDNVNKEQSKILQYDGVADKELRVSINDEVNFYTSQAASKGIDELQDVIETDTLLNHNKKLLYLRGLQTMLRGLPDSWRRRKLNPTDLPLVIDAFRQFMLLDEKNISIEEYVARHEYSAVAPVVNSSAFDSNPGMAAARDLLLYKYCLLHPAQTFITLRDRPLSKYADTLIRIAAHKYPAQLYSFAQASNTLSFKIRNVDDPIVQAVVAMSKSKSGQQYFPFLDEIIRGNMTIAQIDSIKDDSVKYFRLLVNTQITYTKRIQNGETPYEHDALEERLATKARDVFINTINGLHEASDPVRFRSIQNLNAQELYYLAVMTDGLIYTSSYTKGVYPLMMKKINARGDSLLLSVQFDHYRKFISQAAAYNTLSDFLSGFPGDDATTLMRAFAGNLEKSTGLEDGVDVADSYASIYENNKPLAAQVAALVQENYQRCVNENNKRGITIYNLLNKLFLSADSTNNIDLTKEFGIPPVYTVPVSSLQNEKHEVVMQMFFYGDEDGKTDYSIFQNMYANSSWKIDKSNKQWTVVRSVKGSPVTIYANIPFDEETGDDDKAQQALGDYFDDNNIIPTVTINRGHSYHAMTTIEYMAPTSRIVFMGSCGGFNLIDAILKKSPDAHIISSKQIGKRDINRPFLLLLSEKLRAGQNIDWIPFWQEFKNNAKVVGFEDYIPPYKNLGAIFIKAYKKAMGDNEEESVL